MHALHDERLDRINVWVSPENAPPFYKFSIYPRPGDKQDMIDQVWRGVATARVWADAGSPMHYVGAGMARGA